jgi:hypothetical protein
MIGGEPIKETLEKKRNDGWEGWKVPVLLLHNVIEKTIEQGQDYIVFAVEIKGTSNSKKRPKDGHLTILGLTMDKKVRDSHLKANPKPLPVDPPGQIDQFPPW